MKKYTYDTGNIIALCHIIEEFNTFNQRLISKLQKDYNREFAHKLWAASTGKKQLGLKKAKKFYEENKDIIDTINQYTNISRFINGFYTNRGELDKSTEATYKYLLAHQEELDTIIRNLTRIKSLGFSNFYFDEEADFTKEKLGVYPTFKKNFYIYHVANPKVIPNYQSHIQYETEDSSYKMELSTIGDTISEYGRYITLNSLTFDPNTLPEEINVATVFEPLLKQKQSQHKQSETIKKSVDLSVSINDLAHQLSITNSVVENITSIENHEQLLQALANIKQNVEILKTLSQEYNERITEEDQTLTSDVLENEKQQYLKRREWAKIDID